jgi:hypothetical protein
MNDLPPDAHDDPAPDFKQGTPPRAVVIAVLVVIALLGAIATVAWMPGREERQRRARETDNNADNKEGGGCPCGCERSEALVRELRERPVADALRTIDDSLETIAAREATGYVTEAQVEHRLNLLALREDLGDARPFPWVAPRWQRGTGTADGPVRVVTELVVHGEATETVHGRPKLQRAHFVARIQLRNAGPAPVVIEPPRIAASVGMPVSRWYTVGTAGHPWDGRLGAGEERATHAIGYLDEPVPPGTEIAATIAVGAAVTRVTVRARARWDEDPEAAVR